MTHNIDILFKNYKNGPLNFQKFRAISENFVREISYHSSALLSIVSLI